MRKTAIVLITAFCLASLNVCLADEKSDAEAAIQEAEAFLAALNSRSPWIGPALVMKMEAEKYLQMAKEAFEAGDYSAAMDYAKMAMEYGRKAEGLRLYFLSFIYRGMIGGTARRPQ
ncbi:MAG: hypothetical protein HXS41_07865 [Theionarchaea archaeon]|nr:hypothetical protein [Theionarchaea archaeon]MBU7020962.1 hypothetical protein [Theionarchaea archaeon]MBU7034400.1 hypothetical protein [Theionarchaea archaeon]MBU7040037.1 hypothetical protein [Theionarchaea archaeon]